MLWAGTCNIMMRRRSEIVRGAARDKYTLSALVMGIVKSTPFQMREAQK